MLRLSNREVQLIRDLLVTEMETWRKAQSWILSKDDVAGWSIYSMDVTEEDLNLGHQAVHEEYQELLSKINDEVNSARLKSAIKLLKNEWDISTKVNQELGSANGEDTLSPAIKIVVDYLRDLDDDIVGITSR